MENSKKITKSNKVLEASYRLTLNEQRLVLLALSQCDPKNDNGLTKEIKIYTKDFAKQFNLKEDVNHLIRAVNHLFERVVTLIDNDEKVLKTRFIQDASTYTEGAISFTFSHKIVPYLFNLQNKFKSYNIDEISKMNSGYSVRFYELFKQREDWGKRILLLNELRYLFDLEKNKYKQTRDFKKRVLDKAMTEINEHTDLEIQIIKTVKPSRKIEGWEFSIKPNKKRIAKNKLKEEKYLKKQADKEEKQRQESNKKHFDEMQKKIKENKKKRNRAYNL